jgi:naringenin degradation protein FdeH
VAAFIRRIVTGHNQAGTSVVVSDGGPPQNHNMRRPAIGADFFEVWNESNEVPELASVPAGEPNDRGFSLMPSSGHLVRIIDVYPLKDGGERTVMHRTKSLDYGVVIEGEIVLIFEDTEVVVKKGDVVVQRGTNHAWENRSDSVTRMAFFHVNAEFSDELLAKLPKPLELLR